MLFQCLRAHKPHVLAMLSMLEMRSAEEHALTQMRLGIARMCMQMCCELLEHVETLRYAADDLRDGVLACVDAAHEDSIFGRDASDAFVSTGFVDFVEDMESALEMIDELWVKRLASDVEVVRLCRLYETVAHRMLEPIDLDRVHASLDDLDAVFESVITIHGYADDA